MGRMLRPLRWLGDYLLVRRWMRLVLQRLLVEEDGSWEGARLDSRRGWLVPS
jgi:hypothetical protein